MGGLSVAADVAARLPESGVFRKARIVFYNALFHSSGYNGLASEAEKDRIFDAVLRAMNERYHPDILLIACNTLSVVYDRTAFARTAPFPVVGIVETGVDLIARQFAKTPGATALLFGTKTTIESEAHKKALVALGFPAERIHGQACHNLAGAIERGIATEETVGYIRKFVGEALAQAGDVPGPLFASFNCTHFGYARQQFADAFAEAGQPGTELLDPNPLMADFLFKAALSPQIPADGGLRRGHIQAGDHGAGTGGHRAAPRGGLPGRGRGVPELHVRSQAVRGRVHAGAREVARTTLSARAPARPAFP